MQDQIQYPVIQLPLLMLDRYFSNVNIGYLMYVQFFSMQDSLSDSLSSQPPSAHYLPMHSPTDKNLTQLTMLTNISTDQGSDGYVTTITQPSTVQTIVEDISVSQSRLPKTSHKDQERNSVCDDNYKVPKKLVSPVTKLIFENRKESQINSSVSPDSAIEIEPHFELARRNSMKNHHIVTDYNDFLYQGNPEYQGLIK